MRLLRLAVAALVLLGLFAAPAMAKTVHFGGRSVDVPSHWPVYRLTDQPRMCVRLDGPAIYLGTPGANQQCPSNAMGRRRAILIEPRSADRPPPAANTVSHQCPDPFTDAIL